MVSKRGSCIHSLRHTFAYNALNQLIKDGKDPYCALPYVSTFRGHTSIVNTEIYLRLTLQRYDEV
jgi:integrase